MPNALTLEFRFADPEANKSDLHFDGTSLVLIPMVGDWVQPDNYGSLPAKVTKRIFTLGSHSSTLRLFCE